MNDYEGLNLPQLLALMHESAVPDPVSWMPQTLGWLIAFAWLVAVVSIVAWHRYRIWQRNRYRREALTQLKAIETQYADNPSVTAGQIAILIKRTALAAYPRHRVAQLYGALWAQFLRDAAGKDAVIEQTAGHLATAAYRTDVDGSALIKPARRWIAAHRA